MPKRPMSKWDKKYYAHHCEKVIDDMHMEYEAKQKRCIVIGCNKIHRACGFCVTHYAQFKAGKLNQFISAVKSTPKVPAWWR